MKRLFLVLFAALLFIGSLYAYPRNVLMEVFIAEFCPFSADRLPAFHDFVEDQALDDNVTAIVYHGSPDPWTDITNTDHFERYGYYDIFAVPSFRADGILGDFLNTNEDLTSAFNQRLAQDSPLDIELIVYESEGTINVLVTVFSDENTAVNDNTTIYFALINREFNGYIGMNGISNWAHDLLLFSPDLMGLEFSIEANSSVEYATTFEYPISLAGSDLELEDLRVVVFIQDELSQEVIQSKWDIVGGSYRFVASGENQSVLTNQDNTIESSFSIDNIGIEADTYDITVDDSDFNGWSYQYQTPDGTYISGNSTFTVESLESFTSSLEVINPEESGSYGKLIFTIVSQNNPFLVQDIEFYYQVSSRILVVNSDSELSNYNYYHSALDLWEYHSSGELDFYPWNGKAEEFHNVNIEDGAEPELIIDYFGDTAENFSTAHLEQLISYLERGDTNLILSGSRIPQIITHSDYVTYFGIDQAFYIQGAENVSGIEGDPIGDGLEFEIIGGDGASNAGVPMQLFTDGATPCLRYNAMANAGVHYDFGSFKTVLLGFPIEAISDELSRDQIFYNLLSYTIDFSTTDVREDKSLKTVPSEFSLSQNYPNPFNPVTEISFELPFNSEVQISVFNMLGQEVASLANGSFSAGKYNVSWNASDFSSGIYIYKIKAISSNRVFTQSRKMMLMK